MRKLIVCLFALSAACSRDTSLPPPPGPGSIQGRVVYAVAGQSARVAASGARVTVLGTSIGATTGADGRFVVANGALTDGALLFQVDLDGDGTPDRQTLLELASLGARPGRDLALGDVVVVENARVRGRVLRADVPGTTGHAGTVVFVAQGPFTTLTGDDGSYLFENLPEGRVSVTFFRDGYTPDAIDGIQLGAGQDFAARDVTLARATPPPGGPLPGAIAGQLTFSPAASGAGARVTAAQVSPDPAVVVSTLASAAGTFQITTVPPGLYRLEAAKAGYATAVVSNVMVGAGQEVRLGISLAAQGVTVEPEPLGTIPTCVAGARCDLPNGCLVGQVSCATGSPICAPIGNALDGIPCGTNRVCSAGTCTSVCIGGAACRPASPDQCKEGVVSCTGGVPSCVAGTQTLADGTACGQDQVCSGGTCTSCVAGKVCAPATACHTGLTSCATGAETCLDTGLFQGDGTPCGSNLYCAGGACAPDGACVPGETCSPAGQPCHAGALSCATGRPVCADLGTALANGTTCTTAAQGQGVCGSGTCVPCVPGEACQPASPCRTGKIACGTGARICVEEPLPGGVVVAGTSCSVANDRVCDGAGACVACVQGQACTPTNSCHAGGIACASGAPVCADLGVNLTNGTVCGTDQVCSSGTCVACLANASCTPPNPCHYGNTSCATGASVCGDTGVRLSDGAACGADQVCSGGSCVACAIGAACDGASGHAPAPASPDACKTYGTLCASGTPSCAALANRPDGTSCPGGTGWVCRAGACSAPGYALRVALGGLGSLVPPGGSALPPGHGYPEASFVVTVEVVDVLGNPVLTPQTITAAAPAAAVVTPASVASSASAGRAAFTVTLGRTVGPQTFRFQAAAAFQPLDLALTVDQPPDGIMIPLVNATNRGTCGNCPTGAPGPASGASWVTAAFAPAGVAVSARTGDIYVSESGTSTVTRVSPEGLITGVAGAEYAFGYLGDGGTATAARLNTPVGIALDERDPANPILFVADSANHRVRQVNLATGTIDLVAGDGTTGTAPPYGDGPDARAAQLSDPAFLALEPDGSLLVSERGHARVRRISPPSGGVRAISTVVTAGASCAGPLVLSSLAFGQDANGSIAIDENGRLFLSGAFCGGPLGGGATKVVARLEPDGAWALVAGGGPLVPSTTGVSARTIWFRSTGGVNTAPAIAFDRPEGGGRSNLVVAIYMGGIIGRVDGASGRWDVLTTPKSGASTSAGEFGPIAAAHLPFGGGGLAFAGRDLVVTEGTGSYSGVRLLTGARSATASSATLAAVSGGGQTIWTHESSFLCGTPGTCDKPDVLPLVVRLSDATGAPLAAAPGIQFAFAPTARPGGSFSSSTAPTTDSSGYASAGVRAGWAPGAYDVRARFIDIHGDDVTGSPATFPISATSPTPGTVFTVVNDTHVAGSSGMGGPAITARVGATYGLDFLPDGSLVFVANHAVMRVDANGILTPLAGVVGSTGFSGDGGPATSALLAEPRGVAVDRARQILYVADQNNNRIRAVDLLTGFVSTFAGTGTYSSAGDGGPAALATFMDPTRIWIGDGSLYLVDYASGAMKVRRIGIDPADAAEYGRIFPYLQNGASAGGQTTGLTPSCTGGLVFVSCSSGTGTTCSMASDPSGALYLSARFCGGAIGPSAEWGIARIDPASGALQHVAGRSTGSPPLAGQTLAATRFQGTPTIAFDAAGRLWVATRSGTVTQDHLGWIAPGAVSGRVESTGTWNPVGQNTTASVPPQNDFSPAAGYWFGSVWDLAFDANGHLFFTDSGDLGTYLSNSVRVLW